MTDVAASTDVDPVTDELGLDTAGLAVARQCLGRDAAGRVCESTGQMMDRVAACVAEAEDRYRPGQSARWTPVFATMLRDLAFLPNLPTLSNAGSEVGVPAGCFVLPIDNSLESIFSTLGLAAALQAQGAGAGFSLSQLPAAAEAAPCAAAGAGPVAVMRLYDAGLRLVEDRRLRRGAYMGVLDVHHPDIEAFVAACGDGDGQTRFMLSVGVTDSFLHAAAADREAPLIDPATGRTVGRINARDLLERVAEQAWRGGRPGLLFLDAINRANPLPGAGPLAATNPCGEVPLRPFESCNLASVNLPRLLSDGHIDQERLERVVHAAVRFLDDIVDVTHYPTADMVAAAVASRKIGLGVMGLADVLAAAGVAYGSEEGVRLVDGLMCSIAVAAHDASRQLAVERGPFPLYPQSIWAQRGLPPMRNAQVTSIAPTGSICLIGGASPGVEPYLTLPDRYRSGSGLPAAAPATAREIAPYWHVRMQAAVQRHVDAAVAKTVNLPATASVDDVRDIIWQAWQSQCKGITVYRAR
jgi:ribonucleoside-diphosphate reductase alpha chain